MQPETYAAYVRQLTKLRDQLVDSQRLAADASAIAPRVEAALDGQASAMLRALVSLQRRRDLGAFFTGSELSELLVSQIQDTITPTSVLIDPACGAGSLLLAAAAKLRSVGASDIGGQLIGRDLDPDFAAAARVRLEIDTLSTGSTVERPQFLRVRQGDGLKHANLLSQSSHILMNPPFYHTVAGPEIRWAQGRVNMAAVFLETCLRASSPGAVIAAILPDVLRSGSRYAHWRTAINEMGKVLKIEPIGRFDNHTDVDVFILCIKKTVSPCGGRASWTVKESRRKDATLSDKFHVSVGAVVDNRDPLEGPRVPYLKARGLPFGVTVREILLTRHFKKRLHKPPFVVVRRTSNPKDLHRLRGTLVTEPRSVAVDNHLIVLTPKDGSLEACEGVLAHLSSAAARKWIDDRIRCRHLTVQALVDLPYDQ